MATEELIENIYGYVKRRTTMICGSAELASDLTQNVLIKIIKGLKNLKNAGAFIAWTEKIIRNEYADQYRRKTIFPKSVVSVESDDPAYSIEADQLNKITNKEAMKTLSTSIKKLTLKEQTAFYLREYEGYNSNEIGKMMGIKPVTARVLYMRAGAKLFKMMSSRNNGEVE